MTLLEAEKTVQKDMCHVFAEHHAVMEYFVKLFKITLQHDKIERRLKIKFVQNLSECRQGGHQLLFEKRV